MPSTKPPTSRISVVIPLYNHARYIEEAIGSVLNQTLAAAEIIVVDDGSTDDSAARVRSLCRKHPQLIFWSQPNQGADVALNAGVHRATGDFVSILNSDDAYCPTRLKECLKVFRRQPDASAVATGVTYVDENGADISSEWYRDAKAFYDRTRDLPLSLINGNFFVSTSNLFAKRAVFREIGYFASLRYAHDLDFFLRLLANGKSVSFLEQPLLRYRSHAENTIRDSDQASRVERAAAVAAYLADSWQASRGDPQAWRSRVRSVMEVTDRLTMTTLVDHFTSRFEFLGLPRLGGRGSISAPLRGMPQPVANELTLAEQSERIARHEETIATMLRELEEKRVAFVEQEETIAEMRSEFARQEANIAEMRSELEEKRAAFDLQEESIAAMRSELEEKRTGFARQEENIAAMRRHLEERRAAFALQEENIAAMLADLEEQRAAFARQEQEIAGMRGDFALQEETISTMRREFSLQESNIAAMRSELEEKRTAFLRQEEAIAAMRSQAATQEEAIAALRAELGAWKQTRFYRLAQNWAGRKTLAGKSGAVLYEVAAWATPEALKRMVRPAIGRDSGQPENEAQASGTYQVRVPAPRIERRPRIVHAIANFFVGGSSRLVVDLIERLGDVYEQEVITSHIPTPPAYAGLSIHEYRDLAAAGADALRPYFEKFRPDLIHVHYWGDCDYGWYEAVFQAARACGCRIVENINTPVKPYAAAGISRYVYVSEYVLEHFGESGARSEVIHPGSDFEMFSVRRDRLPQPACIGTVYRLERDKLDETAIEPFIEAIRRRPGTTALIVGGGSLLEPFKAAVAAAGLSSAFTFTGYVPYEALPGLYSKMTLFVAPVWKESFGQVSPFAMSMTMPVVGYDVGALKEILGSGEFLAPPGDAHRLADIIVGLLDDPARIREAGQANRERAHSLYSVQSMIDRYADLYQRVLRQA